MTPTLTRSMLLNKHEGPDELQRAEAKFQALLREVRQRIEALDPTTQEKAG